MEKLPSQCDTELNLDSFRGDETFGIAVVGMAQAGKTTLRNGLTEAWKTFDTDANIIHFSNSDGFRGLSAQILCTSGVTGNDEYILGKAAIQFIEDYLEKVGVCHELLNSFYHDPRPDEMWRTNAINSFVAYVSEHPSIRPLVNAAGARFMREIIEDPSIKGLSATPDLFILDARNIPECETKFEQAGIRHLSSFILICDEEVVASRSIQTNGHSIEERTEVLRERNRMDAERDIAPMSLPHDFLKPISITNFVLSRNASQLYYSGKSASLGPKESPLVLDTAKTLAEQTKDAMPPVLLGMLSGVNLSKLQKTAVISV